MPLHPKHQPQVHKILRANLLARAGVHEPIDRLKTAKDFLERFKTEWNSEFIQLMQNRLVMGSMRYETFGQKARKSAVYDYVKECFRRLRAYLDTGNREFLVDAANMCLLEFTFPFQKNTFFSNENDHNVHAVPVQ